MSANDWKGTVGHLLTLQFWSYHVLESYFETFINISWQSDRNIRATIADENSKPDTQATQSAGMTQLTRGMVKCRSAESNNECNPNPHSNHAQRIPAIFFSHFTRIPSRTPAFYERSERRHRATCSNYRWQKFLPSLSCPAACETVSRWAETFCDMTTDARSVLSLVRFLGLFFIFLNLLT